MTASPSPATDPARVPPFAEDFSAAARGLRAALAAALVAAGAPADQPQEMSRRLQLDKSLAWKISRVVGSEDPYRSLENVPGQAGLRIVARALRKKGVPTELVQGVERAATTFARMVATHAGDRATLHAVIAGLAPDTQASLLLEARKMAFRGNCTTFGVQAETHFATFILAPSQQDASQADVVQLLGLRGFRRLRASARWPLLRLEGWTAKGPVRRRVEPLDPLAVGRAVPWVAAHCSEPLPEVERVEDEVGVCYLLSEGPIGLTGSVDCCYGVVERRVGPVRRTADERISEFGTNLLTPARRLQLDLLLADDLRWTVAREPRVLSRLHWGWHASEATGAVDALLPVAEVLVDLGQGPAGLVTPHIAGYADLVGMAMERMGWEPGAFRGWRLSLEFPPLPATALIRCALPE